MVAPPLAEVALDWCHAKSVTAASTSGNSDKARRTDLARWGRAIKTSRGEIIDEELLHSLEHDLDGLTTRDLSSESLLRALDLLKRSYSPSTLQRQLSSVRGFCRWLATKGLIDTNPFDDEVLQVRGRTEQAVRAFTPDDVTAMIEAAGEPSKRARSAWPARDEALIDLLAATGTRNGECVALRIGDIGGADRPVLHIQRGTKSGRVREVPLAKHTVDRLDKYLAERGERGLAATGRESLFIRNDGRDFTTDALYHLVKRLAQAAAAHLPDDALVHGLRHYFGLQLAMRGVPPATLQQLMGHQDPRTTSIYTRHASFDLINALDDAGWLS
ncbi:MAG: tyrosine-type recombinase/integrase [Acidimicrobiaceae bacterium]|nr:tyrosine-type recombinase/integrase [Acidimicrobiaceae bacterium]MDG1088868.1 tyrosine-type recombinase/integrase [Acidimicrobiales bacterium]